MTGLDDFKCPFQPKWFCDFTYLGHSGQTLWGCNLSSSLIWLSVVITSRDTFLTSIVWICFLPPCHKTDSLLVGKGEQQLQNFATHNFPVCSWYHLKTAGKRCWKRESLTCLSSSKPCCFQTLQLFHRYGCPQLILSSARLLMNRTTAKSVYEVISLHRFSQGFFKTLVLQVIKWSCQGKATLHWKSQQRCGRE